MVDSKVNKMAKKPEGDNLFIDGISDALTKDLFYRF